eukprot:Phypoly_transcript_10164.p1 GENE.Phypoly_transcript_10164~~Phypoly_transcript_10164.p1  ORF type:complete len:376 (+),score=57.27 Phypoly_transcript_10164:207-1334(+)
MGDIPASKKLKTTRKDSKDLAALEEIFNRFKPKVRDTIEKWIPREITDEYLLSACGMPSFSQLPATLTQAISVPIYDMLDRGGKGWRPALLLLIAEALEKPIEDVIDLTVICEVVHNGTLIIDDIEDRSTHRRGKPCSHIAFGSDLAINAGNAMYFLPMSILKQKSETLPPSVTIKLYQLYITEMTNIHIGQGYDIWWHSGKGKEKVTVDNYMQMCAYKTGTLAKLSGMMAAYVCGATDEIAQAIGKFCESIGVAFQIQDDILCIVGEKFSEGKGGIGEDIREGKRTLMVIHTLQHAGEAKASRLIAILNKHTESQEEIQEAIKIVRETGSIDYARKVAQDLVRSSWESAKNVLPDSPARDNLYLFAQYLIHRNI